MSANIDNRHVRKSLGDVVHELTTVAEILTVLRGGLQGIAPQIVQAELNQLEMGLRRAFREAHLAISTAADEAAQPGLAPVIDMATARRSRMPPFPGGRHPGDSGGNPFDPDIG